jgi:hypothetical protein
MQDPDDIDRYFTERVIGRQLVVDMGLSATARALPRHGVLVDWASGKASISGMAFRSLWAAEPADAVMGQPMNLPGLVRWRRRVLLGGALAWSALLVGLMSWWRP